MPSLPVIPTPPWEPCFNDFSLPLAQQPIAGTSDQAMALAQKVHNKGVDNEAYDFYLLLKSEPTNGWRIPESLIGK